MKFFFVFFCLKTPAVSSNKRKKNGQKHANEMKKLAITVIKIAAQKDLEVSF